MRTHCVHGVRWPLRAGLASSLVIAVACSDATAPVVPVKYLVSTFNYTVGAGDTLVLKAQLADANDHAVATSGKHVGWYIGTGNGQFMSPITVTDADGIATNYFIAGSKANATAQIVVLDENRVQGQAPPISIVAGQPAAYAVTTSTTQPLIGTTLTVTAQLTDRFGNLTPIAGRVVTWSVPDNGGYYYQIGVRANRLVAPNHRPRLSTDAGTFASPTSTTNSQGVATVDFQVGTTISSYIIGADDGHGAVGNSPPITARPGPLAKLTVTVSVSDPPAGATIIVTAHGSDAYGNGISGPGISVQWSASGGTLSTTSSLSDQSGAATTRLTTGSTPGSNYTVTASSPQSTATGTSPTISTLEQVSLASLASGFGAASSCGIATDGKLWCWGTEGGQNTRPIPGKPIGDQTVSAISTSSHSCAISAGTVICWGPNDDGQLGDNTTTSRSTPAPINSSLSFTAVSTGALHTCALTTTGDIWCWGLSADGRLGGGASYNGIGPVKVGGTVSFSAVSAGNTHTCAIATTGDAYCWGSNSSGQLGNGSSVTATTPVLVTGGLKFTSISAGDSHTCGVTATGVYCWGDDTFGELGDGMPGQHTVAPTAVKNSSSFVTIAAGGFHTCAIESGGRAWCWGDNSTGELGAQDFVQNHSGVPIPVAGGLIFKAITVGGTGGFGDYYYAATAMGHSCAITTDGVGYCWGQNSEGELGTSAPNISSSSTPLKVDGQH